MFYNLQEGGINPPPAEAPRGRPLITTHSIKSVADLLPFFNAVCPSDQYTPDNSNNQGMANGITGTCGNNKNTGSPNQNKTGLEDDDTCLANCSIDEYIERMVEKDFLVPLS